MAGEILSAESGVEYRNIPGHPSYRAGSDGSVWSVKYGKARKLKPWCRKGYLLVSVDNRRRFVHHLILETFVGPMPDGCETLHGPGGKQDNSIGNIRWGTRKENMQDLAAEGRLCLRRGGTSLVGEENGKAKLTAQNVREIRGRYAAGGISQAKLAKEYGVVQGAIYLIVSMQTWKHV